MEFEEKIDDAEEDIYDRLENVFDEVMKIYSFGQDIEKIDFDDSEQIPPIAKYLVYNGEDLLKIRHSNNPVDYSHLTLNF